MEEYTIYLHTCSQISSRIFFIFLSLLFVFVLTSACQIKVVKDEINIWKKSASNLCYILPTDFLYWKSSLFLSNLFGSSFNIYWPNEFAKMSWTDLWANLNIWSASSLKFKHSEKSIGLFDATFNGKLIGYSVIWLRNDFLTPLLL